MIHRIPFRGFDPDGLGRIYEHGILPHWRQEECTYFVTFRLADSLPASVLQEMEYAQNRWLAQHGIDATKDSWKQAFARLSAPSRREFERLIGRTLDRHLDHGYGSCILQQSEVSQVVIQALNRFHGTRVHTGDFVVMPNHVHALLRPIKGVELEDVLDSIKSFTANEINELIGTTGELWQRQTFEHIVRDFEQLGAFRRYITANPVKAKLRSDQFCLQAASWYPDESRRPVAVASSYQ